MNLSERDLRNIVKWYVATSMLVEGKIRTPFSEAEQETIEKIQKELQEIDYQHDRCAVDS